MISISRQILSNGSLIAIHGESEEIVHRYHWLFINHGATRSEVDFLEFSPENNFTGVFFVPKSRLFKSLLSMERIKNENNIEDLKKEFKITFSPEKCKTNKEREFSKFFKQKIIEGANERLKSMKIMTDLYSFVRYNKRYEKNN